MEKLIISSSFNREEFSQTMRFKWKVYWHKQKKSYWFFWLSTLFLVSVSLYFKYTGERLLKVEALAAGLIAGSCVLLVLLVLHRRKFFRIIDKAADDFEKMQLQVTYTFSDEAIAYKDDEKTFSFNWSLLTHYSLYKGYLVLFIKSKVVDMFIFENRSEKAEEFEQILAFAKRHLKEKKIS